MLDSLSASGTTHATRRAWVEFQPSDRDLFAAFLTPAEIVGVHAPQRSLNRAQAPCPASRLRLGHGLLLHGIHTGKPPHGLLVQFDRRAVFRCFDIGGAKFGRLLIQPFTEFHDQISVHLW